MLPSLIGRDPEAPKRTREFIDRVQALLNSLLRNDEIEQTGTQTYTTITQDTILAHQVFGR